MARVILLSPISDCGNPSASEEYRIGTIGLTTFGETVFFTCATGYTGDWGSISCESSGNWSSPSGCARVGNFSLAMSLLRSDDFF